MRKLVDTITHVNRFRVQSKRTGEWYTVSQHRIKEFWMCDCMGFLRWGMSCKHIDLARPRAIEVVPLDKCKKTKRSSIKKTRGFELQPEFTSDKDIENYLNKYLLTYLKGRK